MNYNPATPSSWRTAFEEPPAPDAPFRDIARHIDADVIPELWGSFERAPTRKELRTWCTANGYGHRWPTVAPELRRIRMLARPRSGSAGLEDGVVIDYEMLDEIGDMGSLCPFILRGVRLKTFSVGRSEITCGSWSCPTCGPRMVRAFGVLLQHRIGPLETVYVATARWTANLMPRMRQRRKVGQQWFWYRRIDDMVFFISDGPITGTTEPTSCKAMTPVEAMEFFMRDVAWVPGHLGHGWTSLWKPQREERGDWDSAKDWLPLDGLGDVQVAELMARFAAAAAARFGVQIETGVVPDSVRVDLVRLLEDLVQQVRREIDEQYNARIIDKFDAFVSEVNPEDFGLPGEGDET